MQECVLAGLADTKPKAYKLADKTECHQCVGTTFFDMLATDKNVCRLRGGAGRHISRHCQLMGGGTGKRSSHYSDDGCHGSGNGDGKTARRRVG
jgi:hypothetical protein